MTRNQKIIAAVAAVVVLAAGGIAYAASSGSSKSSAGEVIVFSRVQERTLQSTVALNGTLARKQIRNITASTEGLVSAVAATNDSTATQGQVLFSLGGRDAVTEPGVLPFFRALAPGDQGVDVLELKQILAAAGDDPGPMDNYFSQQTQFALAQWQAQHHYPNATPANPESVTVSLQQGTGYKVGTQSAAGLIIGPPAAQTTSVVSRGASAQATLRCLPALPAPRVAGHHDPVGRQPGTPGPAGDLRAHGRLGAEQRPHHQPQCRRHGRQQRHCHAADHGDPGCRRHPDDVPGARRGATTWWRPSRRSSCPSRPAPATPWGLRAQRRRRSPTTTCRR